MRGPAGYGYYALLHRVLEVLVRGVELLFEELDLALEALADRLALVALLLRGLRVGELRLRLLEIGVHHGQLVLERRDLLLLLEQLLLVLLVLGLCLLGAGDGVVCLLAEGLEALSTRRERVRGASTSWIYCAHLLDSLHNCRSCVWLVVKMGGRAVCVWLFGGGVTPGLAAVT